jgi:5-formyltetrahydrofolate cyclo-ligase
MKTKPDISSTADLTEIFHQKKLIRKMIRGKKKELKPDEIRLRSHDIFSQLEEMQNFREASTVLAYWSMADEVFTHDFVQKWASAKTILLPAINRFTSLAAMVKEPVLGIMEPTGTEFPDPEKIDLVIVPGLAFDREGNRLGHGKAYYDKLLKRLETVAVGVCFGFQLLAEVPVTGSDWKLDYVLSDGREL